MTYERTLEGKVILIVGGAQGIGCATARLCAARGARVIVADVDASAGSQVAAEIDGRFIQVDITEEASVQALARAVEAAIGKLDVLIQTAGVLLGPFVPLEEFSAETFRKVLDINVTGTFLCAKHIVPLIRMAGRGVVILTSSGAATGGSSSFAYGSSKGGVSSFAITLANRLEPQGIRVNVLSPGNIDTGMKRSVIAADAEKRGVKMDQAVADSRLGAPEGVAKVLAFLASDEADYVRGVIVTR
jgi:NAD(P)-dependent dehydrogenase (short-subunit alcohol dehydrogenase family)